jgi:cellulose synthase/poly-beta-1,6-N-acetylglucosamine synthase-like glycosyltransferase
MFVLAAGALLVLGTILLGECLAALLPGGAGRGLACAGGNRPRMAVLIPAHDEAAGIGETVRRLAAEVATGDRLIVIADNCSDQTASVAAGAGAKVIARDQPDRRGKGFAIGFGLEHLDADPPEVVVLVDADCRVSAGGLRILAARAQETARPVQAEYLLGAPANANPGTVISAFAVLLRNRVRPRGLHRLGLPCQLTGSGMAFPWRVLRDAPATGDNLVEDLVMGIEMALRGHAPVLCPEVQISSELPEGKEAAMGQRRRWEHGQLHTLVSYGPRLLASGLLRASPALFALGLDLMVPPLALLVMLQGGVLAASLAMAAAGVISWTPAVLAGAGLAAVVLAVGAGWAKFARATIPLRTLLHIPGYALWKVPLYLSLLVRGKQKSWQRTARRPDGSDRGDTP